MSTGLSPAELRSRALRLGPYLSGKLGEDLDVVDASLASDGLSAVTMMLKLSSGDDVVLRVRMDDEADTERRQLAVLEAVRQSGVPAPRPILFELDPAVLGAPFFVMSRLPGEPVTPWSREGRARLGAVGEGAGGEQLLQFLAAIHRTPIPAALMPPDEAWSVASDTERRIGKLRDELRDFAYGPEPILVDAVGWLSANIPSRATPAIVHGDYRGGNLLFQDDRISGVLDWELVHVGDAAEDIAWVTAKANRASPSLACDMVPLDQVAHIYEKSGGEVIDPKSVQFWDVFILTFLTIHWMGTSAQWRGGTLHDVRIARFSYNIPRLRLMVLDALEIADR